MFSWTLLVLSLLLGLLVVLNTFSENFSAGATQTQNDTSLKPSGVLSSSLFGIAERVLMNLNSNKSVPIEKVNLLEVVNTINKLKNLLSDGVDDYKITWDESLALQAEKEIEQCPRKPQNYGEFFARRRDFKKLERHLNSESLDNFSLKPIPTKAIRENGALKIEMEIHTRIGCSYKNCSSEYNVICHFEPKSSENMNGSECIHDREFPKLCVEQPIDHSNQTIDEFRESMEEWNAKRCLIAETFNISDFPVLQYSRKAELFASTLASNCTWTYSEWFYGLNLHIHPRGLEPVDPGILLIHEFNSTGDIPILSAERTVFGCWPANSTCSYSYLCVVAGNRNSSIDPFGFLKGRLCEECSGDCNDGLCIEQKEPSKEGPEHYFILLPESSKRVSETSSKQKDFLSSPWKMWALGICILICFIIAILLVWTIVTTEYD